MNRNDTGRQANAAVVRSWKIQDGTYRGQVREIIPGKSQGRCPLYEVAFDAQPRDGSIVRIRETRSDGWRVVY